MQGLIAVGFGDGNIILEFTRYGLIQTVQTSQCQIARRNIVHQHPESVDIEDFRKCQRFFLHFLVDAEQMFFASADQRCDMTFLQFVRDRFAHFFDHFLAVAARRFHRLRQYPVTIRIQVVKTQIVQFLIKAVQSQPIGDRRVNIGGFLRDAPALFRRHGLQRAHVMQAVGQFDQNNAHVARHSQQHFAEIFRLRVDFGLEFDFVELGNAVDQFRHRFAELLGNLFLGRRRILYHIVQQRGHQSLRVQMPLRQDAGHRYRMGNISFAAFAKLSAMRQTAEFERCLDLRDIRGF